MERCKWQTPWKTHPQRRSLPSFLSRRIRKSERIIGEEEGERRTRRLTLLARSYRTLPGWIHLILIRKVEDTAALGIGDKNDPSRFEKAFKDIPKEAWHTFTDPAECLPIIKDTVTREEEAAKAQA